ncbi:hypothetical protein HMPREF3213_02054 [Heyndrickxia coagulans]|uniref:Uncharacterized protein n=1 Tax=Heyndrickxia coagulans TaxID=1398 RepID=A0A0C5C1C4_HEYCO|nr:hypothetical protein SB48_HM08orf01916 [Heyndrickxia coagulans]KWZ81318.1 hypothetical protein HMPREF3213_02054 [Heyndrickxia coagulans]KYC67032.1 hypothetical protein B4100_2510 [Heyndrickxia coagulans]
MEKNAACQKVGKKMKQKSDFSASPLRYIFICGKVENLFFQFIIVAL